MNDQPSINLFVFIDAFGWEILQRSRFLEDVLVHQSPLATVLGYSSTCIPTILTGKMPQDHGHLSFFYYDPENSPFAPCRILGCLPTSLSNRGRVRRLISRAVQKAYGYSGYFQLYSMPFDTLHYFDYSEKRDIYQPSGINGGCRTIFDHLRSQHVPFSLSDWRRPETVNLEEATRELRSGEVQFAYLYLPEMDGLMHTHGTRSPRVDAKIAWYDQEIRKVLEVAESRYRRVNLTVFSDHGMTDVHTLSPLMSRVQKLNLEFGRDYAAVFDSTMARFWFLNTVAEGRITEALKAESRGRFLEESELEAYGCRFSDQKYGQAFFLMDPGVLICPSHLGEKPLAAMHGYAPEDKDSVAMIGSNRHLHPVPQRLDDMFKLMADSGLQQEEDAA